MCLLPIQKIFAVVAVEGEYKHGTTRCLAATACCHSKTQLQAGVCGGGWGGGQHEIAEFTTVIKTVVQV